MAEQIAWIELCGVTFSGADAADRGLVWENLEGWWGLTDARGNADPIPGGHGSFKRSRILRAHRPMTLSGFILADSYQEMVGVRDRLVTALAAGKGTVRVATSAGTWERYVEIEHVTPMPDHGDRVVDFTIDMVAPDPCRYQGQVTVGPVSPPVLTGGVRFPQPAPWNFGSRLESGSELVIENTGGIALKPVVRVLGTFGTVTVTDLATGNVLALPWTVSKSAVFDSAARRAFADGANVTREMSARQWLEIAPHSTARLAVTAGGTPDVQMFADYRIGEW